MVFLTIPYPAIDPVAIHLGPLSVKWYGLAYMAGLLLGWFYIKHLLRQTALWPNARAPFAPERVDDLLLYMTVGVLLGGRLGYVLFYEPHHFLTHPLEIPAVWHGGMSFHGALLGSIVAIIMFARRAGANIWSVMDLCAAATPMGLFFGRIANFINSEVVGRVSDVPWAMVFPGAGDQPRHPSQLYEAFLEGLVLFIILRIATHRFHALTRPGTVFGLFLVFYGIFRSTAEFFREPHAGHPLDIGIFTPGIVYSIPMILLGAWLVWRARQEPPLVV